MIFGLRVYIECFEEEGVWRMEVELEELFVVSVSEASTQF